MKKFFYMPADYIGLEKAEYIRLENYHWESSPPYRPETYFKMGVSQNGLTAFLKCYETEPKTVCENRDDPVYKDSCLEFFVNPVPFKEEYVNIECNSKGVFLCEFGKGKYGRHLVSDLISLSPTVEPFGGIDENGAFWGVKITLTKDFIAELFSVEKSELDFGTVKANFYKCGDECEIPHYVAFAPVTSLPPGFHNPECFAVFKKERVIMAENTNEISKIIEAFPKYGEVIGYKPITEGHINDTYIVEYLKDDGEKIRFLLQRINTNVFKNPDELMSNIMGVTAFLRKKITEAGGDATRETLTVYPTKDGKNYYTATDGGCWRMYNFVENTYSVNEITSSEYFKSAAESFGNFQNLLADYPIGTLYDTIPDFHNTPSRFKDFLVAVEKDASGRKENAKAEIDFILSREKDCSVVTDLMDKGELPLRVTHNDTKLNNVLFDKTTDKGLCVVDLDTVMPGSSLYDFGDSIRFGANTGAEDEKDLSKVSLNLEYFKAYAEGYIESAGKSLTENEIKYLPFSAKLLTLECGMRFLGDYLNGDVYFKTDYPEHNLVRARTQLKLVEDIEKKYDEMQRIIEVICKEVL